MGKVDWSALKREYITTTKTQKELSEKYGVSAESIAKRSAKENWKEQREAYQDKKTVEQIKITAEKEIDRYKRFVDITDLLLDKIEKKIKALDDEEMSAQFCKQISGAIKDIKEIQMIRSEDDKAEQQARIEKLRKDAREEKDNTNEIVIHIEGDKTSWQV